MTKAFVGFGLATVISLAAAPVASGADDQLFRERIAPILERRCVHCHGGSTPKGNLSLTTAAGASKGGDGGPAVVPGKPDESLLLEMISGEKPAMPQKEKPLANDEVAAIRNWIETGASWPAGLTLRDRRFDGQSWWAFEPLVAAQAAGDHARSGSERRSTRSSWPSCKSTGYEPSPEADRRTLIRRLSFDLLGLPPAPDEIEQFLSDRSPERVRNPRRSAAGQPSLRRAMGPALARRRPLRRYSRLRQGQAPE